MDHSLPAAPGVVMFGVFSVDRSQQELRKNGVRLKVTRQAFRVLSFLLERPGEVVLRDELCGLLWGGNTHVDFEGNLNAIMRDLREALGDSARNPRFVKTEHGQGYRFIAPVVSPVVTKPQEPPATMKDQEPAARPSNRSKTGLLVALGATLVAGAIGFWRMRPSEANTARQVSELTSLMGRAEHASFSPDGSRIAFHWNGNEKGQFDIYSKRLDSEQLQKLTHGAGDKLMPAWSPDGKDIAFVRRLADGTCAIYLVGASGEGERRVTSMAEEGPLAWSADGRWIAYSAAPAAMGIYAISPVSGQAKRLSDGGGSYLGDHYPSFSADGRWLAFFRSFSSGVNELFVQRLDSSLERVGGPRELTDEKRNSRDTAWTPDSRAVLFSSRRAGVRSIWKVAIDQPYSKPEAVGGEDAIEPAINRAGDRIVYGRETVKDTLRVIPLCGAGTVCKGESPRQVMYSRQLARNPAWSPDGRRIAFESYAEGRVQVWLCNGDGYGLTQLTSFDSAVTGTPRWAPDGRSLVLDSRVNGLSKLFVLDVDSKRARQLTDGAGEEMTPSFSHDGKTIYFVSNRGGDLEVWKIAAAGGEPSQITRHGGFYAMESFDGKLLYYATGMQRTKVAAIPVAGGEEKIVIDSLDYWPNFAVGRAGIYFVPSEPGPGVPIDFYSFAKGSAAKIGTVSGINAQGLAISPDGRSLLVSLRESIETNLMSLVLR